MHCTTHDLKYIGWSQQNASDIPDVSTTRTDQPVDIRYNTETSVIALRPQL